MMKTCELCNKTLANSTEGLKNHHKHFHGGITPSIPFAALVEPVKAAIGASGDGSTGRMGSGVIVPIEPRRTFSRIVQEFEWTLGAAIFPDMRPVKF